MERIGAEVAAARREAAPWVERLARSGYLAKGIVYLTVGILAVAVALGDGSGDTSGSSGAVRTLGGGTWGTALLWVVAAGLPGYVVWRLVQAFLDPENEGADGKGLAKRGLLLLNGLLYAGLLLEVVRILGVVRFLGGGDGGGGGGNGPEHWTALVMAEPFGRWAVGIAGILVVGYGIAEFVKARRESYRRRMKHEMSPSTERWVGRVAKAGLVARGITFGIIGFFLVVAAWRVDPDEARGLGGALRMLEEQAWGPWLLGAVGIGLACYGIHQGVKARYRRIRPG